MTTELVQCEASGNEMSLYYDTADDPAVAGGSSCATPTWVFNKAVTGDMNIGETEEENKRTSRDPDVKYGQYSEAQPELEITGELIVDTQYDGWRYINSMRYESYARNILALTQRITTVGAEGTKGKMRNFDRSKAGPETGNLSQQFKLRPASCVKSGCLIKPVLVAVAGTAGDYNPGTFTASVALARAAEPSLASKIAESTIFRALWNTEPRPEDDEVEVFTDIAPLITLFDVDKVDALLFSLGELNVPPPERPTMGTRRIVFRPTGLGGFEVRPLLKMLREIVGNDPATQSCPYMTPKWESKSTTQFKVSSMTTFKDKVDVPVVAPQTTMKTRQTKSDPPAT
jgi:hypothetical protein